MTQYLKWEKYTASSYHFWHLSKHWALIFCISPIILFGLFYAVVIRLVATAVHPLAGIRSISTNWWRILFGTDLFTKPEIMPGYEHESSKYTFDEIYRDIGPRTFGWLERRIPRNVRIFFYPFFALISAFTFLATLGPSYIAQYQIDSLGSLAASVYFEAAPLRR